MPGRLEQGGKSSARGRDMVIENRLKETSKPQRGGMKAANPEDEKWKLNPLIFHSDAYG